MLLKALAKRNGNLIAIAFKSDNFRKEAINKSKEQDNFTRSNSEKSNIATAILENQLVVAIIFSPIVH